MALPTILTKSIPLKAIPDIDNVLEDQLTNFLSDLLTLRDENSARKLYHSLPAIKKHCNSMGLDEVVKMFTMYADGELSIKPISNHFDRVLVGQIKQAYKETKISKPTKFNEKEYKMKQDIYDAITHFDYFLQNGRLDENSSWVFTFLESKGILKINPRQRKFAWERAKEQLPNVKQEEQIQKAQKYLLKQYFEQLETKKQHLKDLI